MNKKQNSPHVEKLKTTSDDISNSPLLEGCHEVTGCFPPLSEGGTQSGRGVFSHSTKQNGIFKTYKKLPYNPKLKERAKALRKAGNLSEILFWNQVKRKKFLSLDFHRQKIIGNYIVDFYCPALNLVVEIDGESHNYKIEYDKKRENYLKSLDLKIIHFDDIDIKRNLNGVMEYLMDVCKKLKENTPSCFAIHPS